MPRQKYRHDTCKEDTQPERCIRLIIQELGYPFHSQIEGDFTVGSLVIEIDGPHHDDPKQIEKDQWKDGQLRSLGFEPWRIPWKICNNEFKDFLRKDINVHYEYALWKVAETLEKKL